MATRRTNEAVVLYRKVTKQERKLEELNRRLTIKVVALDDEEIQDYVRMTQEIDRAVDNVGDGGDALFNHAVNDAGRDIRRG